MSSSQPSGGSGNGGVTSKTGEPVDKEILAEPGELALGVVARGLGNRFHRNSERDDAFESRARLALLEEVERLGVEWNAATDEAGNLFDPGAVEHRVDALLDATVRRIAATSKHTPKSSRAAS
jgi:hypothetical protein